MNWQWKTKAWASCVFAVLIVAPGWAAAQSDSEFYVGAGAGQSKNKDLPGGWDDKDTGWKAFAGWDANKMFSVEAGYVNLGKWTGPAGAGEVKAKGWNVDGRIGVPFFDDRASVYVKGGAFRSQIDATVLGVSANQSKWDWTYGAGAEYDFVKNLGVRAEWERFKLKNDVTSDQNADLLSASLVWKFK